MPYHEQRQTTDHEPRAMSAQSMSADESGMSHSPGATPSPAAVGTGTGGSQVEAVETLLRQAIRLVEQARVMPLSTSVMINRDEVLDVLNRALTALPEELHAARWLLKERDDMRARMLREGEGIIATARARAEQMVQRSEVRKAAEREARRTLGAAEDKSLRMKLETEDWCDQKLAALEALMHKTLGSLSAGRQRLQDTRLSKPEPASSPPQPTDEIYDQDLG